MPALMDLRSSGKDQESSNGINVELQTVVITVRRGKGVRQSYKGWGKVQLIYFDESAGASQRKANSRLEDKVWGGEEV